MLGVLALAVSACGETDPNAAGSSAAQELSQAAAATIEVKSLRAEVSGSTNAQDEDGRSTIDYQAPDRLRSVNHSSLGITEMVTIGSTAYVSILDKPGFFNKRPASSGKEAAQSFFVVLKVLGDAREVQRNNDTFRFAIPAEFFGAEIARGEATVSDGLVTGSLSATARRLRSSPPDMPSACSTLPRQLSHRLLTV